MMVKSKKNAKVDAVFKKEKKWRREFDQLREIALTCPVDEDLKWGQACYSHEGKNIVLIHGFKEYFALLFFKGALLKDPKGILVQQTQNVQSARQIRFTKAADITRLKPAVKAYILEAIEVEKAGLKVEFKETKEFAVPKEFQARLSGDRNLKKVFSALTPGRQRAYLLFFSAAKQSKTREARIDKCLPRILDGLGLND